MAIAGSQLGQLTPADANAASLYSPGAGVSAKLTSITIVNTSASNTIRVRLFHDEDGTTYGTTTAVYLYDRPMAPQTSLTIGLGAFMNNSAGNFAVRTDTANDATFTLYGMEES